MQTVYLKSNKTNEEGVVIVRSQIAPDIALNIANDENSDGNISDRNETITIIQSGQNDE